MAKLENLANPSVPRFRAFPTLWAYKVLERLQNKISLENLKHSAINVLVKLKMHKFSYFKKKNWM